MTQMNFEINDSALQIYKNASVYRTQTTNLDMIIDM
jgi:hypothetical protein